ncbi:MULTISPECIES: chromosomal replication initiator protein DnaA [Lachnospira]|uniref:Chromosomal replication initiator protein DnaA n=2 Tax=Lachnospira TaxID=28050 RepID=A0ABR7G387_9FIRM|nr:chromosomal replication initiator protein DnaA [Lachnospira hominis]MBO6174667.1 chromosomal replication initiator protein DnaA [Lachnospira sp.]MBS7045527.1 chromosomal replication initiator protein DnaA [Eubacterium sp.]MBO6174686.1 chromosomal replication initiator protein DnaA [Lachnospira sp.]MCI5889802.1 chromosomal replication initiator protein DnaA [Lachnospira sp.]
MMEELKQKWDLIIQTLKEDYDITDMSFRTWIKPIQVYSVVGDKITLLIPENNNDGDGKGLSYNMRVGYIERKYLAAITLTIAEIMGREYDVTLMSSIDKEKIDKKQKQKDTSASKNNNIQNLNPNYTFETFVIGNNNNLAHAASLAVAETPGEVYNPLFIYGGVGLGKTHLMQAIAHFIIKTKPELKVLYVTSETFTNELIDSVKNQKNSEFREKYRNIDVLLIDDIQFIIGKESTQEEFFHTFNALYQDRKQIVISSDRPPKEMETLSERLRTRFEMGLPVDIQIPTYETKMAILNKKAELGGYDIPYEVKDYVATHIKSSIRELEGALTKLSAFAKLSSNPITVEFAEEALKDLISPDSRREITPELIIDIVAEHFNIKSEDILSQKRSADIVYPRQIAMYLCRQMTTNTVQSLGKAFGNRDHTTILHGADKINKMVISDENTKSTIDILIKKINPS